MRPSSRRPTKTTALVPIRVTASRVPSIEPTAMDSADGQDAHPGLQWAEALQQLHELGDQEDEAEQGEEGDGHRTAGGAEPQVGEQADVDQRITLAAFPPRETHRGGQRDGEPGQRRCAAPATVGGFDDRVHQRAQHDHRQHDPAAVQPGLPVRRCPRNDDRGGQRRGQGDGRQREKQAAPPELLEQGAAEDGSDGHPQAGDRTPHADGGRPLSWITERVGDDRQRRGEDQRRGHAHRQSHGDQRSGRGAEGGADAAEREQQQTGDQGAATAEPVADGAAGQHQCGEGQVVGVDDPLQCLGGRAERRIQGWQSDVDDRGLDVDGQGGDQDDREDGDGSDPAGRAA